MESACELGRPWPAGWDDDDGRKVDGQDKTGTARAVGSLTWPPRDDFEGTSSAKKVR